MIETQDALDNLDAILSVKGLGTVYIGHSDLSISLGYAPGGGKPDEWMMTAVKQVLDGCKRHKVQPGIHCGGPAYAKKMISPVLAGTSTGSTATWAERSRLASSSAR
jgi:4-hydroxy-2-oxoheptanedioate aldolase